MKIRFYILPAIIWGVIGLFVFVWIFTRHSKVNNPPPVERNTPTIHEGNGPAVASDEIPTGNLLPLNAGDTSPPLPIRGYKVEFWPSSAVVRYEFFDSKGNVRSGQSTGKPGTTDTRDDSAFIRLHPSVDIEYRLVKM